MANNVWTPLYLLKTSDYGNAWGGSNPFRTINPNPYQYVAPTLLAISPSNPDIMIMDMGNASEFWHYSQNAVSRLLKSTDGGQFWIGIDNNPPTPILIGGQGVPDRFFTHVEFDPKNVNEIYLTLSGYNTGHGFRSVNGVYAWTDYKRNLPNSPVNDLIRHYNSEHLQQ